MRHRSFVLVLVLVFTSPLLQGEELTAETKSSDATSEAGWSSTEAMEFAERLNAIAAQTEALLERREKLLAAEEDRFELVLPIAFAINAAFFAFLGTWPGLWSCGSTRAMLRAFHKAGEKSNE